MKIAVVGSGIAGLAAARALASTHDVTVFERAERAGGHVHTVAAGGHAIDMGFIVCNRARYPRFFRMLAELGIATRPTTMSFSVSTGDLEWSTDALFADRAQLLDRRHWRFLVEVVRFVRRARADLDGALVAGATLDEYLEARRASAELRARFAIPLAAALWSLAPARCGAFPASTYLRFLDQHGMLRLVRPLPWETIAGGSARYVDALLARTRLDVRLGCGVETVARDATGVTLVAAGRELRYDRIIIATHADQALALLDAPTDAERRVLGAFHYSENRTVLHTDRAFLPRRPRLHAAWNHVATTTPDTVAVTYSMTKLQGLPDAPYLVTLNPQVPPRGVLHEVWFRHPRFDRTALAAQTELPRLAGPHTAYAGAYFGFGFHEDGMRSGLAAAQVDRVTSALYRGELMHARNDAHAQRVFRYPVYMAAIDLDAPPRLRLLSYNRRNLFALDDRDYEGGLHGHAQLLAANGLPAPAHTRLVTNLKVLGYVFNPVSFFLGYDAAGALETVIAEVNNTYGGRRRYVLGPAQRLPGSRIGFRHVREFFVSPFLHGDAHYDFWFDAPLDGSALAIEMHVERDDHRVFTARVTGARQPLTDRALAIAALRYPLATLQVIGLIHFEALKLRLAGVPYHRPGPDHRPRS